MIEGIVLAVAVGLLMPFVVIPVMWIVFGHWGLGQRRVR